MTKFKSEGVFKSFYNAYRGLKLVVFSQRNFVIEFFISLIVVILAFILKFNTTDFCILLVLITLVLVLELLNSVIEFTLDAIYKNNYSKLVEMAKDISAGMVMLASLMSAFIGGLLYLKYL